VGIFSFLTGGKTDERDAPGTEHDAPGTEHDARGTEHDARGTEHPHGAPSTEHEARDLSRPRMGEGPLDQPFTPPEAWNIDALTQPPPARSGDEPKVGVPDAAQTAALQAKIIEVIKTVYDPEIPVDIYELGLIYDIIVDADRNVLIRMTLTSPACPSAQQIPSEVRFKVKALPEVTDAWVEIEWEPPWTKDRMSEAAKLTLGFF
jgi:FeS assembly SUF system protein